MKYSFSHGLFSHLCCMHPKHVSIEDYNYDLPEEKIAAFPLTTRDQSKLLICEKGAISEDIYQNIANHIPENSFLVFNDTKVIKARILFQKPTGAVIEIFCLEPYEAINDYAIILQKKKSVRWKCMIGGVGKWKEKVLQKSILLHGETVTVEAVLIEKLPDAYVVEFSWNPKDISFADIISEAGNIPLPPYIKRKPSEKDSETYQTIYSAHEGSVAAPTAGLHFTSRIFESFVKKNIDTGFVTLHVGAGTFKPVKAERMEHHEMHAEWIDVSVRFLEQLCARVSHDVICVGTTSVRTVESLYWMGVKVLLNPSIALTDLALQQWDVYEEPLHTKQATPEESLTALISYLKKNKMQRLFIQTQIIIAPGYSFKVTKGIITNFHQPKSTLLLLVAAMLGESWRDMYEYALTHDFRFLSYGDGCLIRG